MAERKMPQPGEIYRHFKDKLYQIIAIATDSETGEPMVVYQALYGDFKYYVRTLEMFLDKVDKEKYPEVFQMYRFELWQGLAKIVPRPLKNLKEPMENIVPKEMIPGLEEIEVKQKEVIPRTERFDINSKKVASNSEILEANPEKVVTDRQETKPSEFIPSLEKQETKPNEGIPDPRKQETKPEEVISSPEKYETKLVDFKAISVHNSLLMDFLDADSYTKKLNIIYSNMEYLNDRLINDMAVSLDCAVEEGPLETRIQQLVYCLNTMSRFEDRRVK